MLSQTYLKRTQIDISSQQRDVLNCCRITDVEYNTFQFETGVRILHAHIHDEYTIKQLERDKMYWSWFRIEYKNREAMVIRYLHQSQNFNFIDYQNKMSQMIESKRTYLSLKSLLTLINKR